MSDAQPTDQPRIPIQLVWNNAPEVPQVFADEALLQVVGDKIYLALGQVQVPPTADFPGETPSLDVRPVARLVLTRDAFQKLAAMLNGVASKLPTLGQTQD